MEMMINGEHVGARERSEVHNPATLDLIDTVPRGTEADLDRAVDTAQQAFRSWKKDVDARRQALQTCAGLISQNLQELSALLTQEQGKPLRESMGEVFFGSMFFNYFAGLDLGPQILKNDGDGEVSLLRKPLGVVATITPWNFPLAILCWKIAPALMAGNTVVSKPASFTPLSTVKLIELLNTVLPPGVLNCVTGPGAIGAAMAKHPDIRKISFTGSTEVGKSVIRDSAETVKRLTLELGGNDPAIVLDDVDVDAVANDLFVSAFMNAGQTCLAVKRVYAHEKVYMPLVNKLTELAKAAKVDNGMDMETTVGPVNNEPQLKYVSGLVDDAKKRGARICTGGARRGEKGFFYPPTIVAELDDSFSLVSEEQFAPALPVLSFKDVDDAIERANHTHFGLGSSVWSADVARAKAIATQLEAGTTWVNQHLKLEPDVPFGGVKQSGIGREMGPWGLDEFCDLQVLSVKK
jgi:acyl-CoA reductase-like NAD-dependent aldehyde dehydrogenase